MYACIRETAAGFFAGVCRLEDRPRTFRDPPHPVIREWLYASTVYGDSQRCESLLAAQYLVPGSKPRGWAIGYSSPLHWRSYAGCWI